MMAVKVSWSATFSKNGVIF